MPRETTTIPATELLRELSNGVQAASNYMEAARLSDIGGCAVLLTDPALIEKGAVQLARATDAYHRLIAVLVVPYPDC